MGHLSIMIVSVYTNRRGPRGAKLRKAVSQMKIDETYTFKPASPESVYSFSIVLVEPPAPAARADEGRGTAGARRLMAWVEFEGDDCFEGRNVD